MKMFTENIGVDIQIPGRRSTVNFMALGLTLQEFFERKRQPVVFSFKKSKGKGFFSYF